MFAYCLNNPVCRQDALGTYSLLADHRIGDPYSVIVNPVGFGSRGGVSVLSKAAAIAVITVSAGAIAVSKTPATEKKKAETLVDAAVLKTSPNNAIYYGIDFYGGTMNYVTGPMNFHEADVWATAMALSQVYSDRQSWGLYTKDISDAASMAVYLGAPAALMPGHALFATNIFPDIAKGAKYFSHFHTLGRTIHGINAPTFHIWYGTAGG